MSHESAKNKRNRREVSNKSEEEKRAERLVANRKAAFNCRLRKRILIEELQRQVVELTKKTLSLEDENLKLREALNLGPSMSASPPVTETDMLRYQSSSHSSESSSEPLHNVICASNSSPIIPSPNSGNGNLNGNLMNLNYMNHNQGNAGELCAYVDMAAQRQIQAHEVMQLALMRMQNIQQERAQQEQQMSSAMLSMSQSRSQLPYMTGRRDSNVSTHGNACRLDNNNTSSSGSHLEPIRFENSFSNIQSDITRPQYNE